MMPDKSTLHSAKPLGSHKIGCSLCDEWRAKQAQPTKAQEMWEWHQLPVLATIPVINWKIIDTAQGACFEFPDGRHSWPEPRERQIIDAFQQSAEANQRKIEVLTEALQSARNVMYASDPRTWAVEIAQADNALRGD